MRKWIVASALLFSVLFGLTPTADARELSHNSSIIRAAQDLSRELPRSAWSAADSSFAIACQPIAVLGSYPAYVQLAAKLHADAFSNPSDEWDSLSRAEQWQRNQDFLDAEIAKDAAFLLATPPDKAPETSFYHKELEYLSSKGYSLYEDAQNYQWMRRM